MILEKGSQRNFNSDTQRNSVIIPKMIYYDAGDPCIVAIKINTIGLKCRSQSSFSYLLLLIFQVSEDVLVERVVGRRLDPVTGKIYHLKYSPPETEEIAARLTQRFDDTEEKARIYP